MITQHHNISLMRGDTYIFSVRFNGFNPDRNVEYMYFTVSSNVLSSSLEFWVSLDNGISRSDDRDEYVYFIEIDPEYTKDMRPGTYFYDLQVTIDSDVFTLLSGDFIVKADVTPNDVDDFYRNDDSETIDMTEYLQALDVVNKEDFFYISKAEYISLANTMAAAYKAKTSYYEGQFTKYSGAVYAANKKITNSPVNFNTNDWDRLEDVLNG